MPLANFSKLSKKVKFEPCKEGPDQTAYAQADLCLGFPNMFQGSFPMFKLTFFSGD